jgi:hypothetical protein
MKLTWTIAYRKSNGGPHFQRVNLDLTWEQAFYAAMTLGMARPDLQVFYTTSAAYDNYRLVRAAAPDATTLDQDYAEDAFNILTDKGRRIPVRETGKLDPRVCVLPAQVAHAMWHNRAI